LPSAPLPFDFFWPPTTLHPRRPLLFSIRLVTRHPPSATHHHHHPHFYHPLQILLDKYVTDHPGAERLRVKRRHRKVHRRLVEKGVVAPQPSQAIPGADVAEMEV